MLALRSLRHLALAAVLLFAGMSSLAHAASGFFWVEGYASPPGVYYEGIGYWEGTITPDGFGGYSISGTWEGEGVVLGLGFPWVGSGTFSGTGSDINDIGVDAWGLFEGNVYVNGGTTPLPVSGNYDTIYADED